MPASPPVVPTPSLLHSAPVRADGTRCTVHASEYKRSRLAVVCCLWCPRAQPTVSVKKSELCAILGRDYTEDEFQTLCFEFGIELDAVGFEADEGSTAPPQEVWKIEVAANRYDLLCVEGLGRALNTFVGREATQVRWWGAPVALCFPSVLHSRMAAFEGGHARSSAAGGRWWCGANGVVQCRDAAQGSLASRHRDASRAVVTWRARAVSPVELSCDPCAGVHDGDARCAAGDARRAANRGAWTSVGCECGLPERARMCVCACPPHIGCLSLLWCVRSVAGCS